MKAVRLSRSLIDHPVIPVKRAEIPESLGLDPRWNEIWLLARSYIGSGPVGRWKAPNVERSKKTDCVTRQIAIYDGIENLRLDGVRGSATCARR